jgi:transcriptional regulator with XRE-family HTH domain
LTEGSNQVYACLRTANTEDYGRRKLVPLGDLINRARIAKRLSLRGLAREVDIVPSYLADIENDRRTPSESVLRRISAILDLDFDALMQQAGRLGGEAEHYLRQEKLAGQLFRRVAETNLDQEGLQELLNKLEQLEEPEDDV